MTAQLDDLTLVVLGQSDPPSIATSFSGEISHFAIWNRPLTDQEVEVGDFFFFCESAEVAFF